MPISSGFTKWQLSCISQHIGFYHENWNAKQKWKKNCHVRRRREKDMTEQSVYIHSVHGPWDLSTDLNPTPSLHCLLCQAQQQPGGKEKVWLVNYVTVTRNVQTEITATTTATRQKCALPKGKWQRFPLKKLIEKTILTYHLQQNKNIEHSKVKYSMQSPCPISSS